MKIISWLNCSPLEQENLLARQNMMMLDDVTTTVRNIIHDVRNSGDNALKRYTKRFDNVELNHLDISEKEWDAIDSVDQNYQQAISVAYDNIYRVHTLDRPQAFGINRNGIQIDKMYTHL